MSDPISFEFSQLLTKSQRRIYAFILTLIPNRAEAEDILQETNLILCRKASEYDPDRHFLAWAFKIARFQTMAHMKTRSRSPLVFQEDLMEKLSDDAENLDGFGSLQRALAQCMEKLTKRNRELIRIRYEQGMSLEESAKELGKPKGTVSMALYRIRIALWRCVERTMKEMEA
ncbi:MAG: RNA polymerase subunit sigma-70 [Opitutae bacterium]|nr:RNA polymerase subunit sigma-70 [Opitutae bacterium]